MYPIIRELFISLLILVSFNIAAKDNFQKVSKGHRSSSFGYYNTSPENPSGNLISYVLMTSEGHDMELWICDINLENHKMLTKIEPISPHNGASGVWINDTKIAFMDGYKKIGIFDVDSMKRQFTFKNGRLGPNSYKNRLLFASTKISQHSESEGLFEIDTVSGKKRLIVSFKELAQEYSIFSKDEEEFELAGMWNPQFSPDGSAVAFRLDIIDAEKVKRNFLMSISMAKNKTISMFSPTPLHFLWFDNNSFLGFNNTTGENRLLKWSLVGAIKEVLAGPGNHIGISPNRNLYATESIYEKTPIELSIYRRGEVTPYKKVMSHQYANITWTKKNHVNPSFSRDGQRLYFNNAVSNKKVYASFIELN